MQIIIVWFYICSFRPSSPVFVSATKYAHIKFIGALKTVHYDIRSRYLAGLKQEMTSPDKVNFPLCRQKIYKSVH